MNEKDKQNLSTGKVPPWYISLIPILVLIVTMLMVIRNFGADALLGGSQVALLMASAAAVILSMGFYKVKWATLETAILENFQNIGTAVLILLLIGAIAGTWMISGVVPTMIYYGMEIITPKIFLFATCTISAIVSLVTGSSWTTIATIGVALIGIGSAQGFSPGWTAGAIISGAYFGDKISPLSDTTVLASSSSGTPLFSHIRYMLITTVPSIVITLTIFLIVSLMHEQCDTALANEFSSSLQSTFHLSPWLMIIPLVTAILIAKKLPAIHTLFISAVLAGITALFVQPELVAEIGSGTPGEALTASNGFRGFFITLYGSTSIETGSEALNSLVSTRGMTGMLHTIFLIIIASTLSGVLMGSGMIKSLTEMLLRCANKTIHLVTATVGCGVFCNIAQGDQYLSIILTSNLFKKLYKDKGYESRLLSRSVEDSATITSVLVPWNSCGMTQATVLQVPTLTYLPYCFFNILSPLMSITVAAIGYKIYKKAVPVNGAASKEPRHSDRPDNGNATSC